MVDVVVTRTEDTGDRLAAISFRAIFAGWLAATGIAVLLYVGGLAMGFSAFNAWNASASIKGIGIGTAIWIVMTPALPALVDETGRWYVPRTWSAQPMASWLRTYS